MGQDNPEPQWVSNPDPLERKGFHTGQHHSGESFPGHDASVTTQQTELTRRFSGILSQCFAGLRG